MIVTTVQYGLKPMTQFSINSELILCAPGNKACGPPTWHFLGDSLSRHPKGMRDTSFYKEKKLSAPPDQRLPRSYPLPPSTPAERAPQVPLLSKTASCLEPPIKTQLMLLADPDTTWYFNKCSGGCSGGPCGHT